MNNKIDSSRVALGLYLKSVGYYFTSITPESHRLVLEQQPEPTDDFISKDESELQAMRQLLGWNRPVAKNRLPAELVDLLVEADAVTQDGRSLKSKVRYSTLGELIFLHSAFPTSETDAVFFGPDSYRFVRFLKENISRAEVIIDIGCGTGVGGVALVHHLSHKLGTPVKNLILTDINDLALQFTEVNVAINKTRNCEIVKSDLFADIRDQADLVIANPPFIIDSASRAYRHGGGKYGTEISFRIFESALKHLRPGGTLAIYTGASVVHGRDTFLEQIEPVLHTMKRRAKVEYRYEELDPDIFGEELGTPAYAGIERIAAVGLIVNL